MSACTIHLETLYGLGCDFLVAVFNPKDVEFPKFNFRMGVLPWLEATLEKFIVFSFYHGTSVGASSPKASPT